MKSQTKKKQSNNKVIAEFLNGFSNMVELYSSLKQPPLNSKMLTFNNTSKTIYTLDYHTLANRYATDGMYKTLVSQPVLDAIKKDIFISGTIENRPFTSEELEILQNDLEEIDIINQLKQFLILNRLFGGAVLLVNDTFNDNLEEDFNIDNITKDSLIEYLPYSRWEISDIKDEYCIINDKKIKKSNFIFAYGIEAPHPLKEMLNGWGLSVCEPLVKPTNLYDTLLNLLFELISEGKIDVVSINGLNDSLADSSGEELIAKRLYDLANFKKSTDIVALDKEDEYDTKQINFLGLIDILRELKLDICAPLKMPMTKLYGLSANGFNSGEADLQSYNQMIENEIRPFAIKVLRKIIKIECKKLFGFVPDTLKVSMVDVKNISEREKENIKNNNYILYKDLYDNGIITKKEFISLLKEKDIIKQSINSENEDTYKVIQDNNKKPSFQIVKD